MPPDLFEQARLQDMLDSARAVIDYAGTRTLEEFIRDRMLRDAVERRIEIIGEAARGLSAAFRAAHPEIPWSAITATRHILAHDYNRIDLDRIYRIATVHAPALIPQIERLLPPPPPDPLPERP